MAPRAAHLDPGTNALVVDAPAISDPGVVREAQRWTTGRRGPVVDEPTALAAADLTTFATEAVVIGARALAATAQTTEARAVEQMLRDVGDRTFDEAERNRVAAAALGVVRTPEQNGGQVVRVLGARRVVLAFDPETDDPELLRTGVLLLRTVALAAAARSGGAEIATAEERIAEAVAQLEKLDAIKKLATAIQRLLDEALSALGGTGAATASVVEVA